MKLVEFESYLREQYAPLTVSAYMKALRKAQRHTPPVKVLESKMGKSMRTIMVSALKKYASWTEDEEERRSITDKLGRLPRYRHTSPSPERPLDDNEWRALLSAIEEEESPLREVLELLCRTGLRVGDIGRIERDQAMDALETKVLYLIQKGGNYRPYPAKHILDILDHLLTFRWARVWETCSESSERGYYMRVSRALKQAAIRAGLDKDRVHTHLLRKTVATQLLRSTGGDLIAVQKLLGHASVTTTQGYVAYTNVDELAEMLDRLDRDRMEEKHGEESDE